MVGHSAAAYGDRNASHGDARSNARTCGRFRASTSCMKRLKLTFQRFPLRKPRGASSFPRAPPDQHSAPWSVCLLHAWACRGQQRAADDVYTWAALSRHRELLSVQPGVSPDDVVHLLLRRFTIDPIMLRKPRGNHRRMTQLGGAAAWRMAGAGATNENRTQTLSSHGCMENTRQSCHAAP